MPTRKPIRDDYSVAVEASDNGVPPIIIERKIRVGEVHPDGLGIRSMFSTAMSIITEEIENKMHSDSHYKMDSLTFEFDGRTFNINVEPTA